MKKLKLFFNPILILLIILVLGFGVRLYRIDNPVADWHSWRQADTASVSRIYLENGIDLLHPRYHDISFLQSGKPNPEGWRFVEFPIFNAVHVFLARLFPALTFEVWGRLVSVIASVISAIFLYLIGKRFLGTIGGLIATFFFLFMPYNIYFSRVILPEPLSLMFALISTYLFVLFIDNSRTSMLVLSAVFFSLALLVKPYTIFYAVSFFWLALRKHNWQLGRVVKDKRLWIFLVVAFVPVFLWRYWMGQYPEGIPFYKWVFNSDGIRFKPSFWHWIFGERIGQMMLGGWGTIFLLLGILTKPKVKEVLFPLVLGIAMFFYVSVIASANVRHDYYQTLIVPAIALLVSRGVIIFWSSGFVPQPLAKLFTLVLIIWSLQFPAYQIREFYKINHPEVIKAGEALDKIASKDALVIAPYNGDTAFLYHTKRSGWPYQIYSIEELVAHGADYYVSVNFNDPQTQDVMRKFEISEKTDEFVIVDLSRRRMPEN